MIVDRAWVCPLMGLMVYGYSVFRVGKVRRMGGKVKGKGGKWFSVFSYQILARG